MAVRGYLVDLNHITAWGNRHPGFIARLNEKPPECLLFASTITLGELEWGQEITVSTDPERRRKYREFVAREVRPHALDVTVTVSLEYAEVLARVWRRHPPPNMKTGTEAHLLSLGIDVNDVWLVATAKERNLTV